MKFAIAAKNKQGKEQYLREIHGFDGYTDDIGQALLSDEPNDSEHMQLQKGEYWVTVDDSDGLVVMDS